MKIPTLHGIIRRRLLVNFRVDPAVIQQRLPAPFRPKLQRGHAIAGICLIRLEQIRPLGVPAAFGLTSENAAHRVAVEWTTRNGEIREGVFIFRRDTNSTLGQWAGGRLFPGVHQAADFWIGDDGVEIDFTMKSHDGEVSVSLKGREACNLPSTSCFYLISETSSFFERGCVGFSPRRDARGVDGMRLETAQWSVRPLEISRVESSWVTDLSRHFPGSVQFDHALVMRDIPHRWHSTGGPS